MNAIVKSKTVSLPNGTEVVVSETPESWWVTPDGHGYIHPDMAAPDLDQPRQHISDAGLQELFGSIKSIGVRQPITVTPRASVPWARIAPEHEGRPFVIVSGHRRWKGSVQAELPAIPVQVRVYATEYDHYEDASILNTGHEELSDLEKGMELVRLRSKSGNRIKIDQLAARFSMSIPQVYMRMNLTRLHPDIQALLSPELTPKKRLASTVGGILGNVKTPTPAELKALYEDFSSIARQAKLVSIEDLEGSTENEYRFALQKLLLAVIQHKRLKAVRAIELIRSHALRLEAAKSNTGRRPERHQPYRRLEIMRNWLKEITETVILDWTPPEIQTVLKAAKDIQLDNLETNLRHAEQTIERLKRLVQKARQERAGA